MYNNNIETARNADLAADLIPAIDNGMQVEV
jgi:hypothetical protein